MNYLPKRSASERTPEELPAGSPATSYRVPAGLPQTSSLPRQVLHLAVWPFLEQVMGFLVGFVDTALAGHISAEATNAIGVAAYVMWLIYLLINAVGVGATAFLARASGAGRWRRAGMVLGQSLALAALWGAAVGVFLFVGSPWIAGLSGLEEPSLGYSNAYLRYLAVVVPCSAVLGIGSACLRGSGDTRSPFLVMIVVNVVNVVLSVLFVSEKSPFGGHGLAGVAMGTMAAWIAGAVLILFVLLRGQGRLVLHRRNLKLRLPWLYRIVRIGLPNLFENIASWSGNFIVLGIVGRLDETFAIGAHVVGIRIEAISYLPGLAFGMAAATMAGQYLGVGDEKTARKSVLWCWLMGGTLMTFCGMLFMIMPAVFVRVVTNQEVFLELSPRLLFHAGWCQLFFATYMIMSSALRGAGDTKTALAISFGCIFLLRLPLVWYLGVMLGYGLVGIWIATSIELVIRGTLFYLRFAFGNWAKAI